MNLKKMFETQETLSKRYEELHPIKEGEDRFSKKVLALLVELGECANEWRGFKYWSTNQSPSTKAVRKETMMEEDKVYYNPLLEEYVDGLHFILELGLALGITPMSVHPLIRGKNITAQFTNLYVSITVLANFKSPDDYMVVFKRYVSLGEMLGFTWEEIENAYYEKNNINHERQDNGY